MNQAIDIHLDVIFFDFKIPTLAVFRWRLQVVGLIDLSCRQGVVYFFPPSYLKHLALDLISRGFRKLGAKGQVWRQNMVVEDLYDI